MNIVSSAKIEIVMSDKPEFVAEKILVIDRCESSLPLEVEFEICEEQIVLL